MQLNPGAASRAPGDPSWAYHPPVPLGLVSLQEPQAGEGIAALTPTFPAQQAPPTWVKSEPQRALVALCQPTLACGSRNMAL